MTALSLVCTLRNEGPALPRVLPFWLKATAFDRIVLLDFGSSFPVTTGILDLDPRLVLVRVENAPHWKPGLAANLGIAEAEEGVVLHLGTGLHFQAERIAAVSTLKQGQYAIEGALGATGAAAFWRQDWARHGGYHEFMAGGPGVAADFRRRLAATGGMFGRFAPGDLQAIETGPQGQGELAPPNRLGLPAELVQSPEFVRQRNHILAQLVPWEPVRRASAARRALSPRHIEVTLNPPSLIELRAVEMANVIAATFFVAEKERWLGEWLRLLFFEPEIGLGPRRIFPALAQEGVDGEPIRRSQAE
jgi:hypothetical protein